MIAQTASVGIDLYWLPLGAGGRFVRFNGRVYELLHAILDRRPPLELYHSALEVTVPEGRFVIENSWPIPNLDADGRGVTVEGPVGSRHLGRFRVFRYEVRRWREGTIADAEEAVASPRRLSDDETQARDVLALVASVPAIVWGRDELRIGEMWNSNSVISWLLTGAGLPAPQIHPPSGGRAPGWATGVAVAERMMRMLEPEQSRHWRRRRFEPEAQILGAQPIHSASPHHRPRSQRRERQRSREEPSRRTVQHSHEDRAVWPWSRHP